MNSEVIDNKLMEMATAEPFGSSFWDGPDVVGDGRQPCLPRSLYKDPNSLVPYRYGTLCYCWTFVPPAVPGLPGTLELRVQEHKIGVDGIGESSEATGCGEFGPLDASQTDLGVDGSFAYANNYVWVTRGICAYTEPPFCNDTSDPPTGIRTSPAWLDPYVQKLVEHTFAAASYEIISGTGTCRFRVGKKALMNAMGGLTHSQTPANSQGIAGNYIRLQCPVPAGVFNDPDKMQFSGKVENVRRIEDNGDVPFERDVCVPILFVFVGRQFCRLVDAGECPAPGISQLQAVNAELAARLARLEAGRG